MNSFPAVLKTSLHATAAASLIMAATPVLSQDTEEEGEGEGALAIEEVVVTARRRSESLMEVPTAVTAFTFDQMDKSGFNSLENLSGVTAGMNFSNQGGQIPGRYNDSVRFRGMNTNQTAPSQQIGTVFLDGVYMAGGVAGIDFSNVERVEIIKGPQSATFGRSTFAGAVNYVTATPSFEYRGRFASELSDYGGYDISFSHEGPLIEDKLAYRVNVRGYGTDGQYQSNADGGDLGRERTETLQAVLYAEPTDNFSARLRWMFSKDDDGPPASLFLGGPLSTGGDGSINAGTNCFEVRPEEQANGAVADYYCGEVPQVNVDEFIQPNTVVDPVTLDLFNSNTYTPLSTGETRLKIKGIPTVVSPGLKRNQQNWALIMDYDFDQGFLSGATLSSLTGYSLTRASWVRDFDLTRINGSMSQDPYLYEHISQEFEIESPAEDRFRWSLGLSYFDVEYIREGNLGMTVSGPDSGCQIVGGECVPCPCVGGATDFPLEGGTTKGVFGSFGYDITDKLTIDFEWRYQEDEISQDDRTMPGVEFVDTFDAFLPRLTLSYHPVDRSTVWATYSEGNMPGFFNTDIVPLSDNELDALEAVVGEVSLFNEEETLESYEIGWKQQFLDGRLSYSLVGYQFDWVNLKTRRGVPVVLDNGNERTLNVQFNSGSADIRGLELEGSFVFSENLAGTFMIEQTDAEYNEFTCGFSPFKRPIDPSNPFGARDCSGQTPARYPDMSGSLGLNWYDQLGEGNWEYYVRGLATYFGKAYTEEANFAWYGKYWRVNLRAGFQNENLRLEGFVNNLLDDDSYEAASRWSDFSTGINFGFLFSQGIAITPATKRTVGMKLVYEF